MVELRISLGTFFPVALVPIHCSESTFLKDGPALSRFLAILITSRESARAPTRVPMTSRGNVIHREITVTTNS